MIPSKCPWRPKVEGCAKCIVVAGGLCVELEVSDIRVSSYF